MEKGTVSLSLNTENGYKNYFVNKTDKDDIALVPMDKSGRRVKWYLGSFLDKAKIYDDTRDYVHIRLDEDLIEGMKQHQTYTQIDIEISNKFKTKYAIKEWIFLKNVRIQFLNY